MVVSLGLGCSAVVKDSTTPKLIDKGRSPYLSSAVVKDSTTPKQVYGSVSNVPEFSSS